jgi:hypothetical protein
VFEIGSSLREARERKKLDFREIEQATKVRARYIRALEDEEFEILPGQTYVRGFLRAYADYLGLDGQLYVDEYTSRFFVSEEDAPLLRRRRARKLPSRYPHVERNVVILALTGIALLAALVIVAWRFGGSDPQKIPNLKSSPGAPQRAAQAPRKGASLFVQAVRGSSLLQVRAGSAAGRLLYQGTLERGQTQRFAAARLWLNVGSPENLWLRLNGRPVRVGGDCPRVLVIGPKRIASTAHCS